jgi:L-lysine 6-transaminase
MDEVQTGVCITGKFWAHEHFDVRPDVISFGKKTQVCGILASRRIDEVGHNVFHEPSRINSTFGGNLIDMVRFTYILQIIEKENLLENAQIQGDLLLHELIKICEDFPHKVSNARGLGLMCAIDLSGPHERDTFLENIYREKLLLLGCGRRSIRFRPHLIITADEIKFAIDRIRKVLSAK